MKGFIVKGIEKAQQNDKGYARFQATGDIDLMIIKTELDLFDAKYEVLCERTTDYETSNETYCILVDMHSIRQSVVWKTFESKYKVSTSVATLLCFGGKTMLNKPITLNAHMFGMVEWIRWKLSYVLNISIKVH